MAHLLEHSQVLALVIRHRRRCLGLVVVHARIGALGLLEVGEDVGEAGTAGSGDERGIGGVQRCRRGGHGDAGLLQLGDPVLGVLVLDLGELEQGLAAITRDRVGEGAIEKGGVALRLEVGEEAPWVSTGHHPLPSVLPASAAAGSCSWYRSMTSDRRERSNSP